MWQGSTKKNPYGELPPPETCSKKGFQNNLAISVDVETAVDQDITVKGVLMLVEYASHISQSEIETDSA